MTPLKTWKSKETPDPYSKTQEMIRKVNHLAHLLLRDAEEWPGGIEARLEALELQITLFRELLNTGSLTDLLATGFQYMLEMKEYGEILEQPGDPVKAMQDLQEQKLYHQQLSAKVESIWPELDTRPPVRWPYHLC